MDNHVRKSPGFGSALEVWSRRKWLAILVFVGPCVAVISVVTFLPNIYRSTATVLIEGQQLPEAFVRSTVTSAVETRLQTITQDILSRSRLESLITRFGLYADLKRQVPLEEVIERMRRDIQLELKGVKQVEQHRATVAFSIGYKGSNPLTVAQVTNTLASFYIEENLKVRERQAAGTTEFLRVQLDETKKKLDELERLVSAFKKAYMGELPQQLDANLATLGRLNMQLRVNSDNLPRSLERKEDLAKQLSEMESSAPAGGPGATAERTAKLRQELVELSARFTDAHPTVVRVKSEIKDLERQLTEAKPNGEPEKEQVAPASPAARRLRQALGEVDAEIAALKAEAGHLRRDIAAYQQRVEKTPRREQEFQSLSRDYETTKELYTSLLRRYEEAKLAESMEQRQKGEQFRVLDPAMASEQPVAPNRVRLILTGLALSLGLALGAVVLGEQLDTSFHTVDDLRAFTRVPVLVSIPPIVTETDVSQRRWRLKLVAVSATLGLALIIGVSYFVAKGNEQLAWMFVRGGS